MSRAETFEIEPPQRKSSGSGRLLLGIGIGCGVMALLCCGGFAGFGWWATDFFRQAMSDDPARIQAETERIATLDVPDRLQPQFMMRLDPPFVDELGTMVFYGDETDDEVLMLADYRGMEADGRPPSEIFREMDAERQNVPGDGQQGPVDFPQNESDPAFEETSRETLDRPLRGGTARFEIIQGKDTETDQERIIAYGTFPGRIGGGIFMMNVSAENTSVEDVKQVIESLE